MWFEESAYGNRWRQLHPAEKAVPAVLCLFAALLSREPLVAVAIFVLMSGLLLLGARVSPRAYLRLLSIPLAFLLVGSLSLALSFSGGEMVLGRLPLLHWPVFLTHAGMIEAKLTLFRSLGALACLAFLVLTTPITEIVGLLRKLRVPELFLELLILAYRYIFIFFAAAQQIRLAQSARLGYVGIATSWRSLAALGGSLLVRSLERSRRLHRCLLARGYAGELKTLGEEYQLSLPHLLCGATGGMAALGLALGLPG